MRLLIDKSFEKDLQNINDQKLKIRLSELIEIITNTDSLLKIKNIKKLKGDTISYRLRLWDYRIGFELRDDSIILIRFLHRKEIYKYFP
jgi:mRNA interferase RelE/StbE